MSAAVAAPGAHGPGGEHLDAPDGGYVHSDAGPRIETFTESFELVGHLRGGELSILIDRYETNEPVLNGKLEVEFNGLKAPARFHADLGDYAVDDANFLKALAKQGKHSLIFTLTAGDESDLLEGTLEVKAGDEDAHGHTHDDSHDDAHGHESSLRNWAIGGALLAILLVALVMPMLRRKTNSGK
ncbi:hypothetical protein D3878_19495 [Noviherbaspirillum sedimenti]|uniref:Uncharacterized protein n=2 Tax=Noviherbaspirillum sedimenti TaxID=2320865 RepID=A0A3A3GCK5_9BURK|nr:hypothetical protein D3878_19495 [Noviherbaspirillum sedimenti]